MWLQHFKGASSREIYKRPVLKFAPDALKYYSTPSEKRKHKKVAFLSDGKARKKQQAEDEHLLEEVGEVSEDGSRVWQRPVTAPAGLHRPKVMYQSRTELLKCWRCWFQNIWSCDCIMSAKSIVHTFCGCDINFEATNLQQLVPVSWLVLNSCETFPTKTVLWTQNSYRIRRKYEHGLSPLYSGCKQLLRNDHIVHKGLKAMIYSHTL